MNFESIKSKLNELIDCAEKNRDTIYIFIITSTQEKTEGWKDYSKHSVKTSYLSRHGLEEIVTSFRKYSAYLEIYPDIEEFLKDYYMGKMSVKPTMIFESSAKGIGKGRDALIPALCDLLQYSHIGSDVPACVLCSSKYQWTSVLRANKISVPDSYYFANGRWVNEPIRGKKYILKLNNECASIGLSADSVMVYDGENLTRKAAQLFNDYAQTIIAQSFIEGYEVEVPILINRKFKIALPPVGLSVGDEKYYNERFFDYDTIFDDDYSLYDFSAVKPTVAQDLQNTAQKLIGILDLSGYMRVDFRVCEDGRYYVIDINNDPCITSCGSFRKSIEFLGFSPENIAGILIGNKLI